MPYTADHIQVVLIGGTPIVVGHGIRSLPPVELATEDGFVLTDESGDPITLE